MKQIDIVRRLVVAALCLLGMSFAPVQAQGAPLRVMTFNVRLPAAQDGANDWEHRRDLLVETIARTRPDVIGTQELYKRQGDYVIAHLPVYAWVGTDRRGGRSDEHMGVFYRRDRLNLVDFGNFWLSETPAVPGSISWGNLYPRMVTWALFEAKADGRRFYFYNTHFPYREEDGVARLKAAQRILDRIVALPADLPVILAGDFNTTPDSAVHALLGKTLKDARAAAPSIAGPEATFHNFTGKPDRRIDWILLRGLQPVRVRTVTDHRDSHYPSDHFPVIAELIWPTEKASPVD